MVLVSTIYNSCDTSKTEPHTRQGMNALLNHLRVGACTAEDLRELNELVLKPDEGLNFSAAPWSEAILVTSCHGPRDQWNQAALRRHCCISGQRLYTCPAEDTAGRSRVELTMEEKVTVASMRAKQTARLDHKVQIAIGMRAMVLINITTEADIANGTCGIIQDIILDSRETIPESSAMEVKLKYPPAAIIFKPDVPSDDCIFLV